MHVAPFVGAGLPAMQAALCVRGSAVMPSLASPLPQGLEWQVESSHPFLIVARPMPVITELEPIAQADDCQGLYPIREVARLTGINPVTLRAWERRYGLIEPKRTESGHRLYSVTDIGTIRQVMGWLERGVSVSKVAQLLASSLPVEDPQPLASEYSDWQARIGTALTAFNEPELERLYGQIFSSYPIEVVFQGIFLPLWSQLLRTRDVFGRTSEWLLLDGFLRGRLQYRLQLQAPQAGQCVVVVGMPELCLELELLVTGLLLSRNDRLVRVLAVGQPLEELSLVCQKLEPQAVVLFASHALSTAQQRRLVRLAQTLNCSVSLAGEAANVAQEALCGSSIACLGSEARLINQRLDADLKATLGG